MAACLSADVREKSAGLPGCLSGSRVGRRADVCQDTEAVPRAPSMTGSWSSAPTSRASRTCRASTARQASSSHSTLTDVTGYLRDQQLTLTYDPAAGTLRAGTGQAAQTITLKAS